MIIPLLPLSLLTQFNLVWFFLFLLPINLAKDILQSGSILNLQKLSKLKTTVSKHGNTTKFHKLELHFYKPIIYTPKPSTNTKTAFVNRISNKIVSCQTGSRSFWSLAKSVSQNFCHSSFPPLKNNSGSSSCTPSSKAHLFALTFASNFNVDGKGSQPPFYPSSTITTPPIKFSTRNVRKALLQLYISKSKGPDGIPAIVLKSCASEFAPVLKKLFQLSYNLGIFPSSWKLALVFPIPKKETNLILQTIALLQSFLSTLRLRRPL